MLTVGCRYEGYKKSCYFGEQPRFSFSQYCDHMRVDLPSIITYSNPYTLSPLSRHAHKAGKSMLYSPQESGQGLVEYALILVFVAMLVIVILALLGPAIGGAFSTIVRAL